MPDLENRLTFILDHIERYVESFDIRTSKQHGALRFRDIAALYGEGASSLKISGTAIVEDNRPLTVGKTTCTVGVMADILRRWEEEKQESGSTPYDQAKILLHRIFIWLLKEASTA